jgi:hypothetical protein
VEYEIKDNLLTLDEYQGLVDIFNTEGEIPWYLSPYQVHNDGLYFYHILYRNNRPTSPLYEIFEKTVLSKIKVNSMVDARINLYIKDRSKQMAKHVDNHTYDMNHKTSVFYIGTNSGKTVLVDGDGEVEVDSIANRLLSFPSNTMHYAKPQTDHDFRYIVNFNYY